MTNTKNKLMNKIRTRVAIAGISLVSLLSQARADDIFKGTRGPTEWQLDARVSYSESENDSRSTTGNLILKYWNGDETGWWGFLNLPYKNLESKITPPPIPAIPPALPITPTSYMASSTGLGDISFGFGPRGRIGSFHWLSHLGFTIPTGDNDLTPALGTGRTDFKLGISGTYLTKDKNFEVNCALERTFTGRNKLGLNPSDETYFGIVAGGKITEKLRFVAGPTILKRDNDDEIINARAALRYTISPKLHFELVGDKGIGGYNIPKSTSIGLYVRCNF